MNYDSWDDFFRAEQSRDYYRQLIENIEKEREQFDVFPPSDSVFKAFSLAVPKDVKVVILGQDPYPTPGNAMGLAFSVNPNVNLPRSLKNIFKELAAEYNVPERTLGDLSDWAMQGVFLLNTVLTVRSGEAGSHRNLGWETFTDHAISYLNDIDSPKVFLLWGNDAQKKEELITNPEHLVLKTAHPSPFSARRGFFGSRCFTKTNEFLAYKGIKPIKWI